MDCEKIIISLTTWKPRIGNIPIVLQTIFNQTRKPDKIVLNLAFDEVIPEEVQKYIGAHNIEVYRVKDTKVYKKLIPTLLRYPKDCIISIDDDFLYPKTMIEDFWETHLKFPDFQISGNREIFQEMQCHCGCASLTKADFFGDYISEIDDELMRECLSDDIVYSFLSTKNHHPYVRTKGLYFENMTNYNPSEPYSQNRANDDIISKSYTYLSNRFGGIDYDATLKKYADIDSNYDMLVKIGEKHTSMQRNIVSNAYKSSHSYRLGHAILKPLTFLNRKNEDV